MFIFAVLEVMNCSTIDYLKLVRDGEIASCKFRTSVNLGHWKNPNKMCSSDKKSIALIKEDLYGVQKLNAFSVRLSHLLSVPVPKGQSSITSLWHPLLVKSPCSFCYFTLSQTLLSFHTSFNILYEFNYHLFGLHVLQSRDSLFQMFTFYAISSSSSFSPTIQLLLNIHQRIQGSSINPRGLNFSSMRLFDERGQEIKNPLLLKNEQKIWVSYGKAYRQEQDIYSLSSIFLGAS